MSSPPLQFLAELSIHIPRVFEQTTRFYGQYACRTRGKNRVKQNIEPPDTKPSKYWARCMKKVFEIDPLECPKCGEQMKIIAFIHDTREIQKIAKHLGYNTWRAPPKNNSSQSDTWIDDSDEFSQIDE